MWPVGLPDIKTHYNTNSLQVMNKNNDKIADPY